MNKLQNILNKNEATNFALLSGNGSASGHLEKLSTKVMMYLLPLDVIGSGPTISIPICIINLVKAIKKTSGALVPDSILQIL